LSDKQRDTLVEITRLVNELLKGAANVSDASDVDISDSDDDDDDDEKGSKLENDRAQLESERAQLEKERASLQSIIDLSQETENLTKKQNAQLDKERVDLANKKIEFQEAQYAKDESNRKRAARERSERESTQRMKDRGPFDMSRNPINPTVDNMSLVGRNSQASSIIGGPPTYITDLPSLDSIKPNTNILTDEEKAAIIKDNGTQIRNKTHTINTRLLNSIGVQYGVFVDVAGTKQSKLQKILKSSDKRVQFAMKTLSRNTNKMKVMPFNMTPEQYSDYLEINGPGSNFAVN
jgi:multidrug efflux pump subunit AcrA (membrane-fusion protein)